MASPDRLFIITTEQTNELFQCATTLFGVPSHLNYNRGRDLECVGLGKTIETMGKRKDAKELIN